MILPVAKWLAGAACAAALCIPAAARAQRADVEAGRFVAQVGTAAVLTPVAFVGGGWATKRLMEKWGGSEERASQSAYAAAYAAVVLVAATPPAVIGRGGRYTDALLGSAAGLGASYAVVKLGNALYDADRRECGVICWTLGGLVVALPGIGATLVYNANRR